MRRIGLLVFALVLVVSGSAFAAARVALVIGNGAYANAPLRNPINDATDVAAALKRLGFTVTLLTNVDRERMERAVDSFGQSLRGCDVGLFYFAGHGAEVGGANYLFPIKAKVNNEADVRYRTVNAGYILAEMESAGAKSNIVILDACRNNPFTRSFRSGGRGLAIMDAPVGSLIAFSTSPGKVAADGSGRNGIYTKHLLRHISASGLSLRNILLKTRIDVAKETHRQQIPWDASSLMSEVFLKQGTMVADGSTYGAPVSQSPKKGSLRIESQPSGAQIFLDGNRIGRTPKTLDGLSPGRVTIRVEKSGYQPMERQAHVLAGDSRLVAFPLSEAKAESRPGRLYVLAKPGGASVRILNISPRYAEGMSLAPGRYHVEVSKSGFGTVRQWVELRAGQDLDVPVTLEKAAVAATSSSPSPGKTWRDPTTGMEFVWVPGGCFQMGSNSGRDDKKPVHEVCVDGFWMGKYEVTQAEWQRVMGRNPSYFKGDRNPVEQVSWNDAQEFIKRLNAKGNGTFRLPSEAEWEYAARSGGKDETYSGSDDVDRVAWYDHNSGNKTHSVGTKAPNGLGLYDMSGNVWEWCQDVYSSSAYSQHSRQNPVYSGGGDYRVRRGGCWNDNAGGVRAADRYGGGPGGRNYYLGFRLLRTN